MGNKDIHVNPPFPSKCLVFACGHLIVQVCCVFYKVGRVCLCLSLGEPLGWGSGKEDTLVRF